MPSGQVCFLCGGLELLKMCAWQTVEEASLTWLLMPQLLWCLMLSDLALYHTSIKLFLKRNLMSSLNLKFALKATRGRHAIIKSAPKSIL